MVGNSGRLSGYSGHEGEHDEDGNCRYEPVCTPVEKSSTGRRRMLGDQEVAECSGHEGEHDEDDACHDDPKCTPVDPNWTQFPPDTTVVTTRTYDPPPTHYTGAGGIDPWAVVDAFGLDYYLGNALKYIARCGKKDIAPRLDDLKKARNYINKAIELEESSGR